MRIDYIGYPLKHLVAIGQEQSTAHDQQKNDTKSKNRKSHRLPSNIHVDDVANNQSARYEHAGGRPKQLDSNWCLP